jgi:tRNA-5-taurinomethyluridine 2-sulfurtransferase
MKIAVLVSGGVDSSVALRLLKDQGHEVEAFYLKIWLEDELAYLGSCPWQEDLAYVEAVCKQAQVPFHVISLQEDYWNEVVAYTIAEVKAGRTPSPDILCNQRIKFGSFLKKIDSSFEKIATGHYANVIYDGQNYLLKRAKDPIKDQTYFLSYLNQEQLSRLVFPIGNLLKSEVRALAHQYQLPNQDRKDSQGICFLGKISFSDFIRHHLGTKPGQLIEFETGKSMGQHEGFWYYTIGQRKGMGLSGGPWFVVRKDTDRNIVYISKNYYSEEKQRDSFMVQDLHWISGKLPSLRIASAGRPEKNDLQVKVRHGELTYQCQLELLPNAAGRVVIQGNDQGLAPGQFAVFYDKDICLGCGIIAQD